MRIRHFIFASLAAIVALVSCEQAENLGMPSIKIEGDGTMTFAAAGGEQQLNLTATRDWMAEHDAEWLSVSPESGSASANSQKITITALENTGMDRTVDVKFTIGMSSQTITVTQAGPGGSAEALVVYSNDFDKEAAVKDGNYWPYPDQSTCWQNQKGTGSSSVGFGAKNITVRDNLNSDTYEGASGTNNIFFGKSGNYFMISDITMPSSKDFTLSFGTIRNNYDAQDNTFVNSEFHVWLSNDGKKWVEIDYTFEGGPKDDTWDKASSTFSLVSATSKLYISFTSDLESSHRLDDVSLTVSSVAGSSVDLAAGVNKDFESSTSTGGDETGGDLGKVDIAAVIAAADDSTVEVEALVVATYSRGILLKDDTGYLLVYDGSKAPAAVGDKVNVKGTKTTYAGLAQIGSPTVSVLSSGNTVNHPTAKVLDGAGMDAQLKAGAVEYIEYTGSLKVSGYYYNVNVTGASTAVGSLSYPAASLGLSDLDGKEIKVTGYYIGVSSGKYVNTMVTAVEATGNAGSDPDDDKPSSLTKVTIAEFLEAEVSTDTWYELTGEITSIEKETYGNFTIKDETGSVYIYGMTSKWVGSNDQSFAQIGLKVGDKVTLGTLRSEHNEIAQGGGSTPAYYISHEAGEGSQSSVKEVVVLTFPDENSSSNGISAYDKEWSAQIGSHSWSINGFNNNKWNNDWTYIRCGSKNYESEGVIATTTAIAEAVSVVVVTFDKCNSSLMQSSTLTVARDAAFTDVVETVTVTPASGDLTYNLTESAEGCYFKLSYPCSKGSSNGFGQVSKVVYGVSE